MSDRQVKALRRRVLALVEAGTIPNLTRRGWRRLKRVYRPGDNITQTVMALHDRDRAKIRRQIETLRHENPELYQKLLERVKQ